MSGRTNPLVGVEAITFDVFGTVVNWLGTVSKEVEAHAVAKGFTQPLDWVSFAKEWRRGYMFHTRRIAQGGDGPLQVDELHRQILDSMLASPQWHELNSVFLDEDRKELTGIWHRLEGWPDSSPGLYGLKKHFIITTLSNGNIRLLVDMAKHADLPWDMVFSTELFNSYKPNPRIYLGAAEKLSLPPNKVALVAAHVHDLRAAASHGYKTIYIRRPFEWNRDHEEVLEDESRIYEEFDVVVNSFVELVQIVEGKR